jgi:hypothetical protein
MFNAKEYIDDMVATGIPYRVAVAMARDEAQLRKRVAAKSASAMQARKDRGDEARPMALNWGNNWRAGVCGD